QLLVAFGQGGQIKMLYDRRQRPQSVYLNNKVHIVFNAGGQIGARPKAPTKPMVVTYDPLSREFSEVVTLGPADSDHHYGPVIWADEDDYLHVLFGCHRTPGTHLISRQPASIGISLDSWDEGAQIAPGISYPTIFRIHGNRELIYYRTGGHTSSWTYRITDDNGKSWAGPAADVTDMDINGRTEWSSYQVTDMDINGRTEWSSYQATLPSRDGKFLHVAFMTYDDNKSDDPKRFYNPRYSRVVGNEWKYNLYYVRIDLQTHGVTNFEGESMKTPIDIDQADAKCRIWDTKWRGAGVPPTIALDENEDPAFLHVLSEETLEDHQYYYVRRADGKWKQTAIARSNHQWNSCHLTRDDDGILHAYLIVGDGYLDTGGYMDRYGGGSVEEWVSADKGNTWKKQRDLTPDESAYPGWKYNNIQPVARSDGSIVDGMLLFYGWKDKEAPQAKAFLLHEGTVHDPGIAMHRGDE
ncbi:MAG: BNR-4 repeat-containing protein, partial [Planctomycetota bacterium]